MRTAWCQSSCIVMYFIWWLFFSHVWLVVKFLGEEIYLLHHVIVYKKYLMWKEVFFMKNTFCKVSLFLRNWLLVFWDITFCDLKCYTSSFWNSFRFGPSKGLFLGVNTLIEWPWLISLAPTNGAIRCQGEQKYKPPGGKLNLR